MVNWIGLTFPFIYLGILTGALLTFSSLYRKRKLQRAHSLSPWFPAHKARDIYLSLLHLESESVPDSLVKAALIRRAVEDVHRFVQLKNTKQGMSTLLQRGSIGDDLWQRFLRAEQEMEAEVRDVVSEANAFQEGWGSFIFQTAHEIAQNQGIRKRLDEIQGELPKEQGWWDKRREAISSEFMKELGMESSNNTLSAASASTKGTHSVPSSKHSDASDEPVLIESGGPAAAPTQGGQGGKKKKKGRH